MMDRIIIVAAVALLIVLQGGCLTIEDGMLVNRCGLWQQFTGKPMIISLNDLPTRTVRVESAVSANGLMECRDDGSINISGITFLGNWNPAVDVTELQRNCHKSSILENSAAILSAVQGAIPVGTSTIGSTTSGSCLMATSSGLLVSTASCGATSGVVSAGNITFSTTSGTTSFIVGTGR